MNFFCEGATYVMNECRPGFFPGDAQLLIQYSRQMFELLFTVLRVKIRRSINLRADGHLGFFFRLRQTSQNDTAFCINRL